MGFLTRAQSWSTHTLSSGVGTSGIIEIGDYAAFGLMAGSTGAMSTSIGFNVGISTVTLLPLADQNGAVVTVPISTTTLQAYDLPPELASWRFVQVTSTAGSTTLPFTLVRKG